MHVQFKIQLHMLVKRDNIDTEKIHGKKNHVQVSSSNFSI